MFASIKNMNTQTLAIAAVMGLVLLTAFAPEAAFAGTGGTEFDDIWTTLTDWMQGTLGRIIAGAFVIVGLVAGVARQSIMAFAIGVGGGLGLYSAPTVIDNVMTATLEHVPAATQAAITISNGLGM